MAAACALVLLLASCDRQGSAERDNGAAAVDCVAFAEHGLILDDFSRAAMLRTLGVPDSVEWTVVESTGGNVDSLFVVRYPALSVSLHKPAGGTEMVDQVRVSDNRYLRYAQAGIGTPADGVQRALAGHTPLVSDDELIYNCHSHPANDNPVTFRLRSGIVAEVIYTYYMD